jgi:hypothetical protein
MLEQAVYAGRNHALSLAAAVILLLTTTVHKLPRATLASAAPPAENFSQR